MSQRKTRQSKKQSEESKEGQEIDLLGEKRTRMSKKKEESKNTIKEEANKDHITIKSHLKIGLERLINNEVKS